LFPGLKWKKHPEWRCFYRLEGFDSGWVLRVSLA
jgi:hypothetical protein